MHGATYRCKLGERDCQGGSACVSCGLDSPRQTALHRRARHAPPKCVAKHVKKDVPAMAWRSQCSPHVE